MIVPMAACCVLAVILAWEIHDSNATVALIEQSDRRIALATRIELLTVDEETGLRGYQTTSDLRFLAPYNQAQGKMQDAIGELRSIATGATPRLDDFVTQHEAWRKGFAEPLVAIIQAGGKTNDIEINLTGKTEMDRMRSDLNEIVQISERTRGQRIEEWHSQVHELLIVLGTVTLAVGILIALYMRNRLSSVSGAFRRALDHEKQRAEELYLSEQNLRTTLISIGDGVITCGVDGCVLMMNPIAEELTGWKIAEAFKRPLAEVFHIVNETTRELVENPVDKVLRLNGVVGMANHTVLIRRNNSEIAIDDSGAPIRSESGEITGIVMVFRDVSLERRTRAALLANEKLAVAGRLAATIAHEIHNPLDSVANLLYLLQQNPGSDDARHFLELAQSELDRVTHISRAMLSLYRESRAPVPIHLKETLEEILLLMDGRFHALNISVSAELTPDVVVEGFPAEIRQVFTNLIANAAEAAGKGGSINIRLSPQKPVSDAAGKRSEDGALVEINDNGPGISPEVGDRLFQPFFTTKGERGTGLGLWISQGIVRKHGGMIELINHPNGQSGATARVFLATKPVLDPGGD